MTEFLFVVIAAETAALILQWRGRKGKPGTPKPSDIPPAPPVSAEPLNPVYHRTPDELRRIHQRRTRRK